MSKNIVIKIKKAGNRLTKFSISDDRGNILFSEVSKKQLISVTEEEAMRNYYEQLLKGDPTDYIPGIPGIGDVKAKKMLAGCTTEEEFQMSVIGYYMNKYDQEWKEYLLANGKLLHIQKDPEDYFCLSKWKVEIP